MFTKILVPLNRSEVAEHALAPAVDLAKTYEGTLILLCTVSAKLKSDPLRDPANDFDWFWPGQSDEPAPIEERIYLNELVKRLSRPGVEIQSLIVKGDEAGAIIGISEAQDIDLIVMTKNCQSDPRRNLLGDVAERVLHHASCSVMVICSDIRSGRASTTANDPGRAQCAPRQTQA